jgi:hypothetical protein
MGTTSTVINSIVDSVMSDLRTATTLGLGSSPRVYERDEHPQAAMNRGDIPCAYVIPVMEGGDMITDYLDDLPHKHEFPITVTAYYMGTDYTAAALEADLRVTRNYAYNFVDYYKTKTGGPYLATGGQIKDWKVDVGYWGSGGGQIVHFWIVKMNVTTYTS